MGFSDYYHILYISGIAAITYITKPTFDSFSSFISSHDAAISQQQRDFSDVFNYGINRLKTILYPQVTSFEDYHLFHLARVDDGRTFIGTLGMWLPFPNFTEFFNSLSSSSSAITTSMMASPLESFVQPMLDNLSIIDIITIVNLLVYAGWSFGNQTFMFRNFTSGYSSLASRPWTLITSIFSHKDHIHLFSNLMSFFTISTPLIRYLTTRDFLTLFIGGGIFANIVSPQIRKLFRLQDGVALGASAAIYSLFSFNAFANPHLQYIYFGYQINGMEFMIANAVMHAMTSPNVDVIAHLSGAAWGGMFFHFWTNSKGDLSDTFASMSNSLSEFFSINNSQISNLSFNNVSADNNKAMLMFLFAFGTIFVMSRLRVGFNNTNSNNDNRYNNNSNSDNSNASNASSGNNIREREELREFYSRRFASSNRS